MPTLSVGKITRPMTRDRRELRKLRSERGAARVDVLLTTVVVAAFIVTASGARIGGDCCTRGVVAREQVGSLMWALHAYRLQAGIYPSTEKGLDVLRGFYLPQEIPSDPWGRSYLYKYPGEHGDEPDVISLGSDGQPGGDGNNADIVSWKNN